MLQCAFHKNKNILFTSKELAILEKLTLILYFNLITALLFHISQNIYTFFLLVQVPVQYQVLHLVKMFLLSSFFVCHDTDNFEDFANYFIDPSMFDFWLFFFMIKFILCNLAGIIYKWCHVLFRLSRLEAHDTHGSSLLGRLILITSCLSVFSTA